MRYFFIISALPAGDLGRHLPSLEKQIRVPAQKLKQCPAVDEACSKMYFSQLNKGPPKIFNISLSVLSFSLLYLAVRQPFPLAIHFFNHKPSVFLRCLFVDSAQHA